MLPKNRPPTHPGEILADTLEGMKMTQVQCAEHLGVSLQTVNTLINGKRSMTAGLAVKLAQLFNTSAEMWLGMQMDRDLWFAMHDQRRTG